MKTLPSCRAPLPPMTALLEDDGHPSGIPAFLRRVTV